jgi:hypothetical protein
MDKVRLRYVRRRVIRGCCDRNVVEKGVVHITTNDPQTFHKSMGGRQVQAARRILVRWFGKLFSTLAVILLVFALSPMGDFWDPRKCPLANTWRWIRNARPDLATAVTMDPRLLYGGAFCAIIGILWS